MDPNIARIENNLRRAHVHASPQHHLFANSPSPQHHLFANSPLNNLPTLEQLSERHRHSHKQRRKPALQQQLGATPSNGSPSDAFGYHTDPAIAAEPSWTVQSAESAASVPPVLTPSRSPSHPASYHPLQSHHAAAGSAPAPAGYVAPSARAAAGSTFTQPPPQFPQALRNCYSGACPGESETCALSRQLVGAREIKVMARDAAICGYMVEMGAAKLLASLVNGVLEAGEGRSALDLRYQVAEEAAAALLNLSLDKTAKHMMRSHGIVPSVVRLADVSPGQPCQDDVRGSHASQNNTRERDARSSAADRSSCSSSTSTSAALLNLRELAVAVIHSLAQATSLKEDLVDQRAVRPLVRLLREPACSREGQKDALYALYLLSMCESGRLALVYGGAVPLLLEVVLCGLQKSSHLYAKQSERFFDKGMHTLTNVSEERSGLNAIISSKVQLWSVGESGAAGSDGCYEGGCGSCIEVSGLQGLFRLLVSGSEATKEHAIAILHRVVRNAGQSSAPVLEEIWSLLRKEKPRPHLEALAKAGAPHAQQLLMVFYPVKVSKQ
ncbi:hypothetical protein CLOM_g2446 [Closterium sp. NIES-68]|nr:hypothetical protein CLOM_g2446 [Closterium sp. NIES-68]GJP74368.1 hypothetical protein CLOP_g4960 [Closterium sp. NIES-67]